MHDLMNGSQRMSRLEDARRAVFGNLLPERTFEGSAVIQRVVIDIDGYAGPELNTDEPEMAAIKAYLRQLIDAHNTAGIATLFEKVRERDEPKVAALSSYREAHMLERNAPVPQAVDAANLTAALGHPIGQRHDHAIPQTIHRFWSGGPLSESAMATLLESAQKTQGTAWGHTLWHSAHFEESIRKPNPGFFTIGQERKAYNDDQEKIKVREKQRQLLAKSGYNIRAIEELVAGGTSSSGVTADELNRATGMAAASVKSGQGYDDLKYFSDIARLMYLHAEGGHHMDVDIGLGDMDMSQQYFHNDEAGQVPLLGTLARDMSFGGGGREVGPLLEATKAYSTKPYASGISADKNRENTGALAGRATAGAGMYNALIASRRGTGHLQAAVNGIMRSVRKENPRDRGLTTGMSFNSELLAGNRSEDGFAERREDATKLSVPPYLLRLQHLTEESER